LLPLLYGIYASRRHWQANAASNDLRAGLLKINGLFRLSNQLVNSQNWHYRKKAEALIRWQHPVHGESSSHWNLFQSPEHTWLDC